MKLIKIIWARLVSNGGTGTTKLKAKRGGALARWIMWSPTRFMVVTGSLLAVLLFGGLAYAGTLIYDVQVAKYEADLAAYNQQVAAEKKAAAQTSGVDPLNGATAGPSTAPKPATSTTTTTPALAGDAAPRAAATKFLAAWSAGAKAKTNAAWIATLQPYATPAMLDSFRLVDHTAMPAGLKVNVDEVLVTDTSAVAFATAGAFGQVKLSLQQDEGVWRVAELVPADDH